MDLKLNETPVRTSRNFNINNIKLQNIAIPENLNEFKNLEIVKASNNVEIEYEAPDVSLTYGLSKELTELVNEKSNLKLKINLNGKNENLNKINFKFDELNDVLFENIQINSNEDSENSIVLKFDSKEDKEFLHNGIITVKAQKNSVVNIIIINFLNLKSNNFIAIENELHDNAKVNYTIVDFGGKNSITNYYSNIVGKNADNSLNTIYLGKENQLFDLNYIGELRGEKSNIDIEVQGALNDCSKKHFKGTIDFKKGAKKATGNENENCMLLSDDARSIALPMLLCSEEDVEGNHSSSAGKVGEKELFYIMSRGFTIKEALKLLVRAKFNNVLENIKDEEIKDQVINEIETRLD